MLPRCHRRKEIQQTGALNRVERRREKDPVRAQGTLNNMIDPATIGTLVCLIAGMILGLVSHIQLILPQSESIRNLLHRLHVMLSPLYGIWAKPAAT
jgi:hypothetical protein